MATQVQYRRGTNAQNAAFTGALAEITVDTTNGTLRVHDAITVGGSNIATVAYVTAQISALSSNSISSGTSNVRVFANSDVTTSAAGTANVLVVQSTGALITGVNSVSGNVTGGNILTAGSISATGNLTANSVFSNGQISSTGNVFAPNVDVSTGTVFCGNIVNVNANSVGNIGSAAKPFNRVFAQSTSAQYADLAEMYTADAGYVAGTVMEFGGSAEITQSSHSHSIRVAGIISTNPSYLMNATLTGQHVVPVALVGRVPCQVVGTIAKGDRLVTSDIPGVATTLDMSKYQPACIIGKSLENYNSPEVGVIEVAVGRT